MQFIAQNSTSSYARNASEARYPALWRNLEGLWDFGAGYQGASPRDFSGFNRHGTVSGGFGSNITWVTTERGRAIQSSASATSDRITIPSLTTGTVWTWETLIKINALTDSWEQLFGGGGIGIFLRTSGLFRIEAGTGLYSNNTLSAGPWYHLAATSDGSTLRIYFNAKEDANGAAGSPTFNATDLLNNASSETFDGVCCYQRFWKRCLTPSEVSALYAGASPLMRARRPLFGFVASGSSFGELIGSTSLTLSPSATISAWGALIASANLSFTPSATISAFGALTGATSFTFVPAGNISGLGSLIGSTSIAFTLACNSSSFGELIGSAGITFTPSATISGYALGLGNASISFTPTGNISAIGALIGTTGIAFAVALNSSGDVILFPVDITGTVVNTACTWGFPRATATTETPRAECNDFAIV